MNGKISKNGGTCREWQSMLVASPPFSSTEHTGTVLRHDSPEAEHEMMKDPFLDPGAEAFLEEFRLGLSSVRDVSTELDHRAKALKATGGYSSVYATDWTPPGAQAIRVCYKELRPRSSDVPEQIKQTRKLIRHLTHEVKIWKDLRHPNILEFIGYAIVGERSDIKGILVSKWCANGNLMQYLRAHPDSSRTPLVYGMANGLHYLHSHKPAIIHGDLKPENVLISDQGAARLCDFGLSRALNELSTGAQTTSTMLGYTIRYSSYEVIIEEMKTVFSDVYAFGCTSIQVLFDKHPFSDIKNDARVITAIEDRKPPWIWDMDIPIQCILSQCCEPDHDKRPSISSVLQDLDRARSMTVDSPLHGCVSVERGVPRQENQPDRPGILSSSDEVVLPPTVVIRASNGASVRVDTSNNNDLPSSPISPTAATGWNTPDTSHHPSSPVPSPDVRTSLTPQELGLVPFMPADIPAVPNIYDGYSAVTHDHFSDMTRQFQMLVEWGLDPQLAAATVTQSQEDPSSYNDLSDFNPVHNAHSLAPPTPFAENRVNLIFYYFSRVSQIQCIHDRTSIDIMRSLVTKSPHGSVASATTALSPPHVARMRATAEGDTIGHLRASNSYELYFNRAQNELRSVVKSGRSLTEAEAIAALHLVSYWLFQGGWQSGKGGGPGWLEALNVARDWYEKHSGILNSGPEPLKTIYKLSPEGRFAARTTMWMDIFSGITVLRPPRFSRLYEHLLNFCPRQSDFFRSTNGCCDEVMFCLSAIINLEYNRYHDERTTMELHDREAARSSSILRLYILRAQLLSIDCSTQPDAALFTEPSVESSASPYPFTHSTPNMPDKYSTSEIFRQAALLYLSTVTSGYSPSLSHTQDAIVALKIAVEAVPVDMVTRVDRSLVFPICLAGCMTDNLNLRAFFGGRLRSLGDAVGNHITALQLMEAVWCMRDSTGEAVAWRDVMNDMKFELLMV